MKNMNLSNRSMNTGMHSETNIMNTKYFRKSMFLSGLFLSNLFVIVPAFALSVQPVQVKSAIGEPFRAELVITDIAGIDPSTIRASLAADNEFLQLGIYKRNLASNLRFKTTITSPERGVITITSDRPLNDPYIEFVVHIDFGRNVRLQQVTALIDPPLTRIQTDSLSLPVQEIQLAATSSAPQQQATTEQQTASPDLSKATESTSNTAPTTVPSAPDTASPASIFDIKQTPTSTLGASSNPIESPSKSSEQPTTQESAIPSTLDAAAKAASDAAMAVAAASNQEAQQAGQTSQSYMVKRRDSLWAIATRMQKDMNIPVSVIMNQIQQNNKSAFIKGNPNYIKTGATIVLPNEKDFSGRVQQRLQPVKVENDDIENNKTPTIRPQNKQTQLEKTPYTRRGRLPDAKMTLVAPNQDGSAQGAASEEKSAAKQRQLRELNLKITTTSQQNRSISKKVSELETLIKINDQKLALQNAKLAALMQRLKNRKEAASQNANRTQKS
jgi:pilus assembly protein FimV